MEFKHPKIAVVAVSGIFPGAAQPSQFIDNILAKKEAIIQVPNHRWAAPSNLMVSNSPGGPVPDRAASNRAGLITDFTFDPAGFGVDRDLLASLDPVHHLVLSAGRQAMADCHCPDELKKDTGVILAAIALPTDLSSRVTQEIFSQKHPKTFSPADALGASVVSAPAAILARAMGFEGGSFTLDAACASSLFAIKLACEQLLLNKSDIMVAGGVSRPDSLYTQVGFTQLQALSPTGRCAPFDQHANGLVVGEGTGLVVLKRLDDALACGDTIHSVITGWGVSNDIEGNLVAPASEGQVRAMTAAYEQAGWSLADIQYMECHGSGTVKGDGVEISSIKALQDRFLCPDHALSIGSVKSMVGHLLTAAGAAGFIKTILAMGKKVLPPSLNFTAPPEHSPIHHTRIRVQGKPDAWDPAQKGTPRRAGISAFGFGGINAHVLVEEYKPKSSTYVVPAQAVPRSIKQVPCAIVGMETLCGAAQNLTELEQLIFGLKTVKSKPAGTRWRRSDHLDPEIVQAQTLFMEEVELALGEFHIPPKQMDDILAQHLVMLKAAKGALMDASIQPRPNKDEPPRHRMGAAIGIDFDFGATDFFLRWQHHDQPKKILDSISPPLTFDRTLGALGGIVASRVAREFKLGGPCFTLSAGAASGMKAIETGIHSLDCGETGIFLCGAVDLAGDIRSYTLSRAVDPDTSVLPSEGAAALVLKRLDQAIEDGDKIYGVINSVAGSNGASLPGEAPQGIAKTYSSSLKKALTHSKTKFEDLSLVTVHGHGQEELKGLVRPTSELYGDTGAASGLFSVISTCLALYQENIPDTKAKTAAVGALTRDGACAHVIVQSFTNEKRSRIAKKVPAKDRAIIKIRTCPPPIKEEVIQALSQIATRHLENTPSTALVGTDHLIQAQKLTARAHETFLDFSNTNMAQMEKQFNTLARAASGMTEPFPTPARDEVPPVFLNREQCLEYAVGKAGNVLGPKFDIIDTYPVRVRLPTEPLMLVDRIMDIQGEMLSLSPGKIITQHDVKPGAWYLDGGLAPVSISIEAGQADLFLCAYLGIDHAIKGKRKYRLLDARVTFHRSLPVPGETIEYHIEIDRFLRQGEIYLFFFHYKGYIDDRLFISMRDGCAGFFTEQEVENSGGIILKEEDQKACVSQQTVPALVAMKKESYDDSQVNALRCGNFETTFGPAFAGINPGKKQWLPGARMTLIHRVLDIDPRGGRFGLGRIVAEADIHADDWFLTCHFIDDQVMPGTLMYECCAHTLRVFVQRMGWVSENPDVHYDVLPGNESDLKCRGPVTRDTQKARYEIEIKEMGYAPEPYVIADAHMFSDELEIVLYKDMGMKLVGITHQDLVTFWRNK